MTIRAGLAVLLTSVPLALPAPAGAADPTPLGHACVPQNGVRFCPGNSDTPSWDGVPLDADVTLPPTGNGPFPTIAMIHGYGGSKTDFEDTTGSNNFHYNTVWFAQHGYAVLTSTARGFNGSCGTPPASLAPACTTGRGGYVHLKDQRVEAHDTQYLLGMLADEGIAQPDAIGVTGISYGGGESIELAYLRDRVRNTDDSFSPWVSPVKHLPMRVAAAWPRWPWSDLVSSLLPNGRFLDFDPRTDGLSRFPLGIPIQSYITGLYAEGQASGHYATPGTDSSADLTTWYSRINAGEPYDGDPTATGIADEIFNHHQGYGLPGTPAPLLIENGWTDDLFPVSEALRVYNDLRSRDPSAPVSLQLGDLGHARGSNKLDTNTVFNDQGTAFFDALLRHDPYAHPPAAGAVTAMTQTCPAAAPSGGPFTATSYDALHPGAVLFSSAAAQTVSSTGGDPTTAQAIDPISGGGDACTSVQAKDDPGTAVVNGPSSAGGFTLLGRPTVQATIATTGSFGQLDSRLWDVGPDGRQVLVTRGAYRLTPNQSGPVTFQLNGNGYRFAPGHTPKLELVGRDAPYLRPSNGAFSVAVSNVTVELPTLETPAQLAAAGLGTAAQAPVLGAPCAETSSLSRPRVAARGRRVRVSLPRGSRRVTVDVFQEATGRTVLGNRLVARFRGRRASFTWSGRGQRHRRVRDGVFMVRLRSGATTRYVALVRRHGRFHSRPAFALASSCSAITQFKLERPVFGGRRNRALSVSYRLRQSGTATVLVRRGSRTVKRYAARRPSVGRLVRLRLASQHLRRGDVRVVLRVTAGGRTTTRTLVARRL